LLLQAKVKDGTNDIIDESREVTNDIAPPHTACVLVANALLRGCD
jgi:hypothetical protein